MGRCWARATSLVSSAGGGFSGRNWRGCNFCWGWPIRSLRGSPMDFPGGAVMEISPVTRNVPVVAAPAETIPADQAAENREVVRAVKALNGTEMFGEDNQLLFQRDLETQRMVIRVVNRKTDEVISQIPAE